MTILKSLCVAFSMYSKIPMPHVEWSENNMKYAMCFFPLVGVVIAIAEIAVFMLCNYLGFNDIVRGALLTVVPVLISGGIHIDGFLDTVDALSSYGDRKKKLEILKDPHTGAFAIIGVVVYFLLYFAFMTEIEDIASLGAVSIGFVLSRTLSALAVARFKCAKDIGLVHAFAASSQRKAITVVMFVYILICFALLACVNAVGVAVAAVSVLAFVWYKYIAYSKFGGITGDVAGYFVCICELLCVIAGGVLCVLL